ncbi:MAG: acyl carrier protein [Oscillospiraceae bacterium]|nr:acyl carrier protein [Oscillospiraceae bacterium]MBP3521940.1 acyl carrier protein [Oscillospiraceae bacterium]
MIYDRLVNLLAEQFAIDPEDINEDTGFEDLGADSVDLVELAMNLEEEFGIDEMGEDAITSIHTVGDLVNYIRNQLDQ